LERQGRWPEALVHLERYYEIVVSNSNREGTGTALVGRAKLLSLLGRHEEAEKVLNEADRLTVIAGSNAGLTALIAERRAGLALNRGMHHQAAMNARRTYEMAATKPANRAAAQCVWGLALARSGSARQGKR